MEPTEATIVPADRRDDSNPIGSTTATDDSARAPVETSHNSTEPDPKAAGSGRSDPTKRPAKKSAKKHRHGKSKTAKSTSKTADSALTDNEGETESSDASETSESDFDSDDEEVETKPVSKKHVNVPKSKPKSTKKLKSKQQSSSSKKLTKKQTKKSQKKHKKKSKALGADSDPDSSSDESDTSDSEEDDTKETTSKDDLNDEFQALKLQVTQLQLQLAQKNNPAQYAPGGFGYQFSFPMGQQPPPVSPAVPTSAPPPGFPNPPPIGPGGRRPRPGPRGANARSRGGSSPTDQLDEDKESPEDPKKGKKNGIDFKRVDWVWDNKIHNFTLQDTTEATSDSLYDNFIFHVRRTFDWEGKYRTTIVDIKSKLLRECLQDTMGTITGVSLVEETPKLDPNLLFLYLEDLRAHRKLLKKTQPAGDSKQERKKNQKRLDEKRKHLKVLLKYLDEDYAATKESLHPMLESGLITFDLLWALWKPNTIACMSTYGSTSEPRAFKVDMAQLHGSIMKGNFYYIDGKYFEYDGKKFGYGSLSENIPEFHGAKKITSLPCYPIKYHQNEQQLRKDLIERGKKFVSLSGVHYKSYQGMAFLKRKKMIIKFNVAQSRIMVDPAIFRRINPNYSVSLVKPKDHDIISDDENSGSEGACSCACDSSDSEGGEKVKFVTKVFKDLEGGIHMARIPQGELEEEENQDNLDMLPDRKGSVTQDKRGGKTEAEEDAETLQEFTDEEYLIASSVVLGFAFSEKQWLEFAVSGIKEIKWNENAWDSLVLEDGTKDLIKALVESRKYHAANTIDDVIQGKGKGLVTVLHGPPGTGKTLTAEGISELLKCPLYMASAGELGTDSRFLEAELQKILDICHAWGAILLLDEADVFLEKRDMHNIHRNALVSIFLRQLEYFQGILFLTTNRVETFDEAFQSRIHIALRYDNLDAKAKRTIFKMFLDRVQALGKIEVTPLTENDMVTLSKQDLNGREIKNVVGSAQDLAVNKGEALSMRHINQVLNVHAKFGRDLKGGTGYEDAMRSYF
ncbi:hypothetical protein AK830_g6217 [Neonectria ditissima]|uniref:AAA+ ATPase domain-containing protein n=1 Tax=Neonectria ditissima TaxID=78410 RepID=A0A0P7B1G2_9HYPO|nr:hypothetical protein AK830_g6217 [Neonectria ditissima]